MIEGIEKEIIQDRYLKGNSEVWANWESVLEGNTCKFCINHHGTIVNIAVLKNKDEVQAHPHCQCVYVAMRTKTVGTATNDGMNGADVFLVLYNRLPFNYITKSEAASLGWKSEILHQFFREK